MRLENWKVFLWCSYKPWMCNEQWTPGKFVDSLMRITGLHNISYKQYCWWVQDWAWIQLKNEKLYLYQEQYTKSFALHLLLFNPNKKKSQTIFFLIKSAHFSTGSMPKNEKPKKKHHWLGVQRCLCRWFVPALLWLQELLLLFLARAGQMSF